MAIGIITPDRRATLRPAGRDSGGLYEEAELQERKNMQAGTSTDRMSEGIFTDNRFYDLRLSRSVLFWNGLCK